MNPLWSFAGVAAPEGGAGADRVYFRFLAAWDPALVVLAAGFLAVLVVWSYRGRGGAGMPRAARLAAAAARLCACAAVVAMIWRPAITLERTIRERAQVIILADKSLSMGIRDMPGAGPVRPSRDEAVAGLLTGLDAAVPGLDRFEVAAFTVGDGPAAAGLAAAAARPADMRVSRIYEDTLAVLDRYRGRPVAAAYLFSDGNVTGSNVDAAEFHRRLAADLPDLPFLAVAVGAAGVPLDLAVTEITAPEHVFVNEQVEVLVRYELHGAVAAPLVFVLRQNGVFVMERTAEARPRGEVLFTFRPDTAGDIVLTCEAVPPPGETLVDNNTRTQVLKAYEGRLRILFVEGTPRWEYRYLRNAILRDAMADLSAILVSADPAFPPEGEIPIRAFPSREELEAYDVIVIGNVQAGWFSDRQMADIAACVEAKGTGLLLLPGTQAVAASYRDTPLAELYPVRVPQEDSYSVFEDRGQVRAFRPEVPPEGWDHPVLQFAGDAAANRAVWEALPPFYRFVRTDGLKPGKTLLARYPGTAGFERADVIFAAGFYGLGKTFFSAVDATWRWRLGTGDTWYYRFWLNVFRYLSSGRFAAGRTPCLVLTGKQAFEIGEQVAVRALVRDGAFQPARADEWPAEVTGPDGARQPLVLRAVAGGEGFFAGSFFPARPGTYAIRMADTRGEVREYQKLTIRLPEEEFRAMAGDRAGLAVAAGGHPERVLDAAAPASIYDHMRQLRPRDRVEVTTTDFELFNHWLLYVLLAAGLCTEWVLRRIFRLN
ncbi:MAG: hypothetical protein ABIF71_03005 [Planctomycetota bacterium]